MAIAPMITLAVVTLNFPFYKWNLGYPIQNLTTLRFMSINDDSSFGPIPPSSDTNQTLLFQDVRYRVFNKTNTRYLNRLAQSDNSATSPNAGVLKMLNAQGTRGLCTTLTMPVLIRRKFATNHTQELQAYKTILADELRQAKLAFAYMGTTFVSSLETHIGWMMMNLDSMWDSPQASVTRAYSIPNWGTTATMAANACAVTLNTMKE